MRNTILSGNQDSSPITGTVNPNASGTFVSQGYNLIGTITGTTSFTATGDITNTNALLGALQNNGGPTLTHAPQTGSQAIDKGNPATPGSGGNACDASDQRGYARPIDGDNNGSVLCDIGAYEVGATSPLTSTTTAITYTYDSLYRLKAAQYSTGSVFTYTYDAVGNRLTQTTLTNTTVYTYDIANRLINVGTITQTWDNNGNLLNDGVFTYTYDSANRLVTLKQGTALTYTYSYNGLGDRVKQVINGVPTTYTLDLNAGLTQVLADGTNTYLYGNGRIAQQSVATTSYFLGDALGSVRQLANSAGQVTLAKSYQPYGSVLSSAGSATTAYSFTGEWQDNTNLLFLRARYYSSQWGRFITADSWGGDYRRPLSLNKWLYVEGNSVNYTDPSGLYRWWNVRNFKPSAPPGSALSWQHQFIENEIEGRSGGSAPDYWRIHLEYTVPRSKGSRVDVIYLPQGSNETAALRPSNGVAYLYEIEPVDKYGTGVGQLKGYLSLISGKAQSLKGQTPDLREYDWTSLQWQIGLIPIPSEPFVFTPPGYNTSLLVWYQDNGVILYAQSNDPLRNFKDVPPIVFYWLQEHQNDSVEVRQFTEMVRAAKEKARREQPAPVSFDTSTVVIVCTGVIVVGGTILILADPVPGDEVVLPALWSLLLAP